MDVIAKRYRSISESDAKLAEFQIRSGRFFRERRIRALLTEEEVSNYLGVSVQMLRAYELGLSPIPLDNVYALSNCLNIPPDEVMELFHQLADLSPSRLIH